MTPRPLPPRVRAGRFAHLALAAILASEVDIAEDTLRKLVEELGAKGIVTAMCDWADQATYHQQDTASRPDVFAIQPTWQRRATGERVDATQVDDQVIVWTGQFIAARLAGDNPACGALLNAIPDGQWVVYMASMLAMCAAMIDARTTGAGDLN